MIGAVGDDNFGEALSAGLLAVGVDVSGIRRVAEPTGIAMIAHAPKPFKEERTWVVSHFEI